MGRRLTDEEIVRLRERFASGERQTELASEYGITQNAVSSIVTGRTRASAGGPITVGRRRKLTPEDASAIRSALAEGVSVNVICERYPISQQMVSLIQTGRAFADVPGPVLRPARRAEPLSTQQVEEIKQRVRAGESRLDVAAEFGVSRWTVDSVMIGRIAGRESNADTRSKQATIREIRRLYEQGITQKEIAARFGLTQQAVSQIVRGEMYPGHGGPIAGRRRRRLAAQEVSAIRTSFHAGASVDDLADRYHVSKGVVARVVAGVTYPMRTDSVPEAGST